MTRPRNKTAGKWKWNAGWRKHSSVSSRHTCPIVISALTDLRGAPALVSAARAGPQRW